MDNTVIETQSPQSEVNRQAETLSETKAAPEKQIPAQKAEGEILKKQDDSIIEKASDFIEDSMNSKAGSFISENIGAVIAAVVITIIACISSGSFLGFILGIPLSFLGFIIGNKLRLL